MWDVGDASTKNTGESSTVLMAAPLLCSGHAWQRWPLLTGQLDRKGSTSAWSTRCVLSSWWVLFTVTHLFDFLTDWSSSEIKGIITEHRREDLSVCQNWSFISFFARSHTRPRFVIFYVFSLSLKICNYIWPNSSIFLCTPPYLFQQIRMWYLAFGQTLFYTWCQRAHSSTRTMSLE